MSNEWLYGKNVVSEVLKAGRRKVFKVLWARRRRGASSEELLSLARSQGVPLEEVSGEEIASATGTKEHQGVAVQVVPFEYTELSVVVQKSRFLVLLDEIQDPHNVGALIRTAHCCGAGGVVLLKHRSALITPAVCKAAAGAEEHIPILKETNMVDTIKFLKENGFFVAGAAGEGGRSLFEEGALQFPAALVLGNEGKGLRRLVREHCDQLISIPMKGLIQSLNVSVAGGIFMAEIMRKMSLSS